MNPGIFREYDIRGLVGSDLDEEVVELVGRAFGTRLVRKGRDRVLVGRDVRLSSPAFAAAFARGLAATGIEVTDLGELTTPMLYWAIIELRAHGGAMITGSHNPVDYNGIKICEGTLAIHGESVQKLRRMIEKEDFDHGEGSISNRDLRAAYVDQLLGRFAFTARRKIVVDCGNGVAGPLIPGILRRAGHEVIELYTEPDGRFPNHLPDPEVPEYMADLVAKVRETGADCGFGFDGDADRLGVIDETGHKISADWLLCLYARDLLSRHRGGTVRFDVKCSDFVEEDVRNHGGVPIMGRTGHSILKQDMKELDAILGGELSGHIVFGREYHLIDDSFYCALKVLEVMEKWHRSCSGLFADFPATFSTAEIKAGVPEATKFERVGQLVQDFQAERKVITIDGARVVYDQGWGLVRASNTTANLTLRFEARSAAALAAIQDDFVAKLSRYQDIDLAKLHEARRS
ncbi:MAG: phosphomannomutase/phosphoglucomutase [Planctomycetes bacterium]|nr:phosphomannomutase/phosphoglucomutase [Planctomycetota bacterium]